jgi:hypothetical protein
MTALRPSPLRQCGVAGHYRRPGRWPAGRALDDEILRRIRGLARATRTGVGPPKVTSFISAGMSGK